MLKKPEKKSPCAKKTNSIHETLLKIQEQLDGLQPVSLNGLQGQLDGITKQLGAIIELLNSKLALDVQEKEIMDLLQKKLEGT